MRLISIVGLLGGLGACVVDSTDDPVRVSSRVTRLRVPLAPAGSGERPTTTAVPCFGSALADVDARVPGVQRECVTWLEREGPSTGLEIPLPACGDPALEPCFRIARDPQACPPNPLVPVERATDELLVLHDVVARGEGEHFVTVECVAR